MSLTKLMFFAIVVVTPLMNDCSKIEKNTPQLYSNEELLNIFREKECRIDWKRNRDIRLTYTLGYYSGNIYTVGYDIDSTGHFNSSIPLDDPRHERSKEDFKRIILEGDKGNSIKKVSPLPIFLAMINDYETLAKLYSNPNYRHVQPYCLDQLTTYLYVNCDKITSIDSDIINSETKECIIFYENLEAKYE